MRNIIGIFLIALANLILLAHVIVPHSHCAISTEDVHNHAHQHDHGHNHDHDSDGHSSFEHFFCTISHVEENFTNADAGQLELISIVQNAVVIYSFYKPFESALKFDKYIGLIESKVPIYHSPFLIRSGEKAPPTYLG